MNDEVSLKMGIFVSRQQNRRVVCFPFLSFEIDFAMYGEGVGGRDTKALTVTGI